MINIFKWSKWTDVAVINFAMETHLVQGRYNKSTNKKEFRTTKICNGINIVDLEKINSLNKEHENAK